MDFRRVYLVAALWLPLVPALAGQVFESGPRRATVIELYTSQGCSSCPPAEAYLNGLRGDARLWRQLFPMALHVDYWDHIGWKDRFAAPAHGARQRRYARVQGARTVYTPAFFVNGRPWRRGLFSRQPALAHEATGRLRATLEDGQVHAVFRPAAGITGRLQLHVALLGMGLESRIAAGERAGSRTRHEFVVRALRRLPPVPGQTRHWAGALPAMPDAQALVIWVSHADDPAPLQATGGWLGATR